MCRPIIANSLLNRRIHMLYFGVTVVDATPGSDEAPEGEKETAEVPLDLEEWTVEVAVWSCYRKASHVIFWVSFWKALLWS